MELVRLLPLRMGPFCSARQTAYGLVNRRKRRSGRAPTLSPHPNSPKTAGHAPPYDASPPASRCHDEYDQPRGRSTNPCFTGLIQHYRTQAAKDAMPPISRTWSARTDCRAAHGARGCHGQLWDQRQFARQPTHAAGPQGTLPPIRSVDVADHSIDSATNRGSPPLRTSSRIDLRPASFASRIRSSRSCSRTTRDCPASVIRSPSVRPLV